MDLDEDDPDARPPGYLPLDKVRPVENPGLPPDLRAFYAAHEGVGLSGPSDRPVRLVKFAELRLVGWSDLFGSGEPIHPGWGSFSAFKIGRSDYGDEILRVVTAPGIPRGSVLATGVSVMFGPPGEDRDGPEGALIVAGSFGKWIARLERHGPIAHGLYLDLENAEVEDELKAELAALNPYSRYAGRRR